MIDWIIANWQILVAVVVGIYEVVVRIIPTVGDITIIGKIIAFLKWLSDNLNRTKK
jgi:hypothetical protein